MDNEEPRNIVVSSEEFFWRKFNQYLMQMVVKKITKKQFVDNMMKLGYTEKQLKKILITKKGKPHDTQ